MENEIQAMENVDLDDEAKLKEWVQGSRFRVTSIMFPVSASFIFRFWNMKSENCPEIRREMAEKSRRDNKVDKAEPKVERSPKFFTDYGRPYNLNSVKLDFVFHDEADRYELDLHVYKYVGVEMILPKAV